MKETKWLRDDMRKVCLQHKHPKENNLHKSECKYLNAETGQSLLYILEKKTQEI